MTLSEGPVVVSAPSLATFTRAMARHAVRSVRSGGLPFFFSVLMTAAGALALAAYATVVMNVERLGQSVGRSVAAVAFLRVESAADAEEVRATFALDPRVAEARLISPAEALARARRALGDAGRALDGGAGVTMPWVVEVTPRIEVQLPTGPRADSASVVGPLIATLQATPGVEEVLHPSGDMARVESLLRFLKAGGALLGLLLALVVLVVVTNALKIAVFHRRDEIAVLKLVGATDLFVRVPLLISGLVQGVAGALLGLAALAAAHASLAEVTRDAFSTALGTFVLEPMPLGLMSLLVLGGGALGVIGAALAVGRFLRA